MKKKAVDLDRGRQCLVGILLNRLVVDFIHMTGLNPSAARCPFLDFISLSPTFVYPLWRKFILIGDIHIATMFYFTSLET